VVGAQRIARIEVAYSLPGLRRGRIDRLVLSNVETRARWRDGVVTLSGFPMPLTGGQSGGIVRVGSVIIDGFRTNLDTARGPVTIEGGRAEVEFSDGDADIAADMLVSSATGHIKGRLTATLFEGGEFLGRFVMAQGAVRAAQGSVATMRGVVQIIVGAQGPELDARLDITGLNLGGREIPSARINVAAKGTADAIAIDGQLTLPMGKIRLRGIVAQPSQGELQFAGTGAATLVIAGIDAVVSGDLRFVRTARGDLSGTLAIAAARLGYRALSLDGVTGKAVFAITGAGAPTLDATLAFKRLRAPGANGLPGTVSLRLNGPDIAVRGTLNAPGERLAIRVDGVLGQTLDYQAKGNLTIGTLLTVFEITATGSGSVAFDLGRTLADPLDFPADFRDALTLSGTLNAALDDIAVPARFQGGGVRGEIGLSLRPGDWRMTSDELRLSATHLAKDVLAPLPDAVEDRFGGGVRLTVNGPASLRIVPVGGGYDAAFAGTIQLDAKDITLRVTGKFESIAKEWIAAGRYTMAGSHRTKPSEFLAPLTMQGNFRGGFTLRDNILVIDAAPESFTP
jgi:hypothetical protein